MPLPNYGYFNKESKNHQQLVFEMAPEIVDVNNEQDKDGPNAWDSRKVSQKRAKVTTGKLGIDLERKLVINEEKDPNVWASPKVCEKELKDAQMYSTPERKNLRKEVRSSIDSLISGHKLRELRSGAKDDMNQMGPLNGGSINVTSRKESPPSAFPRKLSPATATTVRGPASTISCRKTDDFTVDTKPIKVDTTTWSQPFDSGFKSFGTTQSYSARSSTVSVRRNISSGSSPGGAYRNSTSEKIIPVMRE